jgi:hypothetical protein
MTDVLTSIVTNIPVLSILGGFVVVLVAIISSCVISIRRDSTAAKLKQDMLDRGMSADEIKTVLEARPKS